MAGAIMETQHVRYFLAICEELSFTRAAQKCGIKQPTLSEAIKQMERAMGGKLFVRGSPVQLTNLGFQLQPVCMQIILDFIYHEYFRASLSGAKVASAI